MNMQVERLGDFCAVLLTGRLEPPHVEALEQQLASVYDLGCKWLLFDLSGLDYLGSLGLRVFVAAAKRAKLLEGEARFCGVHGLVKQVFDLTRLSEQVPLFDNRFEAMKGFPPTESPVTH